jgi:hypothetical protein
LLRSTEDGSCRDVVIEDKDGAHHPLDLLIRTNMDDDTRQEHKDWLKAILVSLTILEDDATRESRKGWRRTIPEYCLDGKLRRAEHLWNEYQYRHDLVWNLVFRLTAAVVVLAIIPYTQETVMNEIGIWILAPPILGVGLAIFGWLRVHHELILLNHIRNLYRPLQDSLFYDFHGDKKSWFGAYVRAYLGFLIVLALINILFISTCWIPEAPLRFCDLVTFRLL